MTAAGQRWLIRENNGSIKIKSKKFKERRKTKKIL